MSTPAYQTEADSNNFDNEFEKLDPLAPSESQPDDAASEALNNFVDDLISSSSPALQAGSAIDDLYSPGPPLQPEPEVTSSTSPFDAESLAEADQPLVDIGTSQEMEPPAPALPSVPLVEPTWPASDPILPSQSLPLDDSPAKTMSCTTTTTVRSATDEIPKAKEAVMQSPTAPAEKASLCCKLSFKSVRDCVCVNDNLHTKMQCSRNTISAVISA